MFPKCFRNVLSHNISEMFSHHFAHGENTRTNSSYFFAFSRTRNPKPETSSSQIKHLNYGRYVVPGCLIREIFWFLFQEILFSGHILETRNPKPETPNPAVHNINAQPFQTNFLSPLPHQMNSWCARTRARTHERARAHTHTDRFSTHARACRWWS